MRLDIGDPADRARVVRPVLDTREDVDRWFDDLLAAGLNFHPEDSFLDMVEHRTGGATFTPREARAMDSAMRRAYEITGDACEAAIAAFERMRAR